MRIYKTIRRKIERSEAFAEPIAAIAGRYLMRADRTTTWQVDGLADLEAALAEGPVLLVMWHSRSVMGAIHWPLHAGPLSSLYDKSPIGRVSGALQRRVGLQPIEMSRKLSNVAASRTILRRVKDGVSIGMTGDGPKGPARHLKDAPLEWARVTQMPLFCYAFATTKGRRLDTWDQMLVPKAGGQGAQVFRRFDHNIPRNLNDDAREALRRDMLKWMDETTATADRLIGHAPDV